MYVQSNFGTLSWFYQMYVQCPYVWVLSAAHMVYIYSEGLLVNGCFWVKVDQVVVECCAAASAAACCLQSKLQQCWRGAASAVCSGRRRSRWWWSRCLRWWVLQLWPVGPEYREREEGGGKGENGHLKEKKRWIRSKGGDWDFFPLDKSIWNRIPRQGNCCYIIAETKGVEMGGFWRSS